MTNLREQLEADLFTIDPSNAIEFLQMAEANDDILKVESFKEQAQRNIDVIECLKIHLECELTKWEAEQEYLSDVFEQARAKGIRPTGRQIGLVMGAFRKLQRMEAMPNGQGTGFFWLADRDRDQKLERYHHQSNAVARSAMYSQASIDNPKGSGFKSYSERNTESCRTLLASLQG